MGSETEPSVSSGSLARISGWIWSSVSQPISPPWAALAASSLVLRAMAAKSAFLALSCLRWHRCLSLALSLGDVDLGELIGAGDEELGLGGLVGFGEFGFAGIAGIRRGGVLEETLGERGLAGANELGDDGGILVPLFVERLLEDEALDEQGADVLAEGGGVFGEGRLLLGFKAGDGFSRISMPVISISPILPSTADGLRVKESDDAADHDGRRDSSR